MFIVIVLLSNFTNHIQYIINYFIITNNLHNKSVLYSDFNF